MRWRLQGVESNPKPDTTLERWNRKATVMDDWIYKRRLVDHSGISSAQCSVLEPIWMVTSSKKRNWIRFVWKQGFNNFTWNHNEFPISLYQENQSKVQSEKPLSNRTSRTVLRAKTIDLREIDISWTILLRKTPSRKFQISINPPLLLKCPTSRKIREYSLIFS